MSALKRLITQRIEQSGPITVADYMALALAHPDYGYYRRHDPLGANGDFTTAPEISQIFGELIGLWLAEQWHAMGKPDCLLVEPGPGRGTLMQDILRATKRIAGFHDALTVLLVETSPVLRQKQQQCLHGAHPHLQWRDSLDALPELPLLMVANEFFDALPIRQYAFLHQAWHERAIGLDQNHGFCFTFIPLEETPHLLPSQPDDGMIYEIHDTGLNIMQHIATHIVRYGGAVLLIDYGYHGGTRGDTLQAVKRHAFHDPLQDPGEADITSHIDFAAFAACATQTGATVYGPVPQGQFLRALGAEARLAVLCKNATQAQKSAMISGLERLISPDHMGALFNILAITSPAHPAPEGA